MTLRARRSGTARLLLLLLTWTGSQVMVAEPAATNNSSNVQTAADREDASSAAEQTPEGDEEGDPDRPASMRDKIDEAEYLRLRQRHILRLRGLGDPNRKPDPSARSRAIHTMQQQEQRARRNFELSRPLAEFEPFALSMTTWSEIGPSPIPNGQTSPSVPVSGRVTAIAVHPTNPDIAYVGTAQGGLYRTLNGGISWTQLWDSQLSLSIGALVINPLNPSIVFVGTGESNLAGDSFFGVGLYRINNAETTPIISGPFETRVAGTGTGASNGHAFLGTAISAIAVDPGNSNRIFVTSTFGLAGIGGTVICCGGSNPPSAFIGLYFSENALSANPTFSRVNGIPGAGFAAGTDVVFEPGSSGNLLVGAMDFNPGSPDSGIWRTTAANTATGATSPAFSNVKSLAGQTVDIRLAINKVSSTTTVVAATGEPTGTNQPSGKLHKSTDGGATWPTTLAAANGFCGGQCFYDIAVAIDAGNANNIYIGGSAGSSATGAVILKKSTNGGASFTPQTAGLHADTHAIAIAPSNANVVYTGNDGGIFRTTNASAGAISWNSLNTTGFNATQFQSLALHPGDREFMIGGTQDNGTNWKKPDASWTRADFGDGGFALIDQGAANTTNVTMYHTYFNVSGGLLGFSRITSTACASDNEWVFRGAGDVDASTGCEGVARSSDNGINLSDNVLFYAPIALGPGTPNTVYFGSHTLYRSVDRGDNMVPVSQAPLDSEGAAISAIGISLQDDNVRIVGTENGRVFATTNGSSFLTEVTPTAFGWPGGYIARAVIDPNNSNTAYVTISALGDPEGSHVWRTTNLAGGAGTWVLFGNGIPDIPVNAFVVDPANSTTLFAGTDIGVFRSVDGLAWTAFGLGLPRVAVFDLAIQNDHRVLRAATHGRGIWEIALPPDYLLSVSNPSQTVFVADSATFTGTLRALGGYNASVTITCQPGNTTFPGTCTGGSAIPGIPAQPFSVTASSASAQDFSFNIRGVGSDPSTATHTRSVNLSVVDVNLGAPNPTIVNVVKGNTSSPLAFQATASGSYAGTLTLGCTGLPSGATCNFLPGTVSPRSGLPSNVSLTVSTLAGMPDFAGTITITATSSVPFGQRIRTFTLNITTSASTSDLSVVVSHEFIGKAQFGTTVPFNVTVNNAGPSTANNVVLSIFFVGARLKTPLPAGCSVAGSAVNCSIGQLLSGSGAPAKQFVFEAKVSGAMVVTGIVSSDSADANQANNSNTKSIRVQPRPRSLRGN